MMPRTGVSGGAFSQKVSAANLAPTRELPGAALAGEGEAVAGEGEWERNQPFNSVAARELEPAPMGGYAAWGIRQPEIRSDSRPAQFAPG
jgi:hypothetical protein